ncbi:SMI1/KNR4 family protein [Streptomyces olivoreticuli]
MSEADIREAEAELGIAFPDQYREYLLRQSAGGAVNLLSRSGAGWGWHADSSANYDLLTTAFPHPDSYRVHEDDLDAREPPVQLSVTSIFGMRPRCRERAASPPLRKSAPDALKSRTPNPG